MVDRDYFKEYYENHRDRIRAQTRERVARWHKNHHQEFLASRRTEEYRKKRRKTLLHYVNLYFSKYGSSIDISDLWPSLRKYANRPLREIVKGKKEREFLNVTQYSLRRKEDKPIIAYFLLERYKNKGYKNDKNKKASSFIISLLGESPIETLKNYEEKLRSNIKGVYSKASKEKADKIFNENVEEYRKRYDKCSNFVREEYHKIADSTEEKYDKIVDPAKERYDKTVASAEEKYNKIVDPAVKEYNKVEKSAWEEYNKTVDPAWEKYNKAIVSAWEEYNKIVDPALKEYDKAVDPIKEKYDKAIVSAWEEYNKIVDPAWEEYNKAIVSAWEEYFKIVDPAWEKYDKIVDPAKERYDKTVASAEEKYNKIIEPAWEKSKREDGYYRCPISDCNAKFKHLEKLKQHYFVRHGEGIKFILYLFEDKVNKLYLK